MIGNTSIQYIDYQGHPLPHHDGTMIEINNIGYQFFDLDGKGFIHDGTPITLLNGKSMYFLHDGKAIIHDGSPLELSNGMIQHFDHNGLAVWPIDEKKLAPLMAKQREVFFKERIEAVTKNTPLEKNEIEELRLALMACEHPDYLAKDDLFDFPPEANKIKATAICEETEGYLLLLKGFWCSVWRDYQLRHRETLSARYVLRQNTDKNCLLAAYHLSESMLAGELKREFKKADKEIEPPKSYKEFEKIATTKTNTYILDDRLIKYFSRFGWGDAAEELIKELKSIYKNKLIDIKSRIKDWQHPLFLYRCIANIVWFDIVKPKIKMHYVKAPALPLLVSENMHSIMKKGTIYDNKTGKITDKLGQELACIEKERLLQLPSVDIATMQKILSPANIKVLNSVNAHRLLRWEIQTVTKQVLNDKIDARHIYILGGYEELARLIGAGTGRKIASQIRDILMWQGAPQQFTLIDPETHREEIIREANMISFQYTAGGFKSLSSLEIVVGTMLVPHYLYKLIKTSSTLSSEALKLIPIVDIPNLIGRPNDQGAQLSFQMELMVEMRKGAKEFAQNECVFISKDRLANLAKKAGLSEKIYPKVIDAWTKDGDNAPSFLRIVEQDRYALSAHFKQAQDFIIQGGKKELLMSKAGKRSVAKRNAGYLSKEKTPSKSVK